MKQIYIVTGTDEWLTNVVIEKLINKYTITLVKIYNEKFNLYKSIKLVILFGIINTIKIFFKKIKNRKIKIIYKKKDQLEGFLKKINRDKIFLINLSLKIKKNFKNIFNCHPAILPNYKGLLPIQRNIYDNVFNKRNNNFGVTIHQINEKFDEGKIVWNKVINIKKFIGNQRIMYEKVYSNFSHGIDQIVSNKKIYYKKIKKDYNCKKNLNFNEILKLKLKIINY
tara:strand:+ start:405 stop:1079 length:675 start_codon:yes stop_codon:yes gene_type:complete